MIERRGFCAAMCELGCVTALASVHSACGGDASSTSAPSGASAPGPPNADPVVPLPPAAVPPPTSGTVTMLPVVTAVLRQRTAVVMVGADSPLSQVWGAARTRVVVDSYPWDFLLTRTGSDAVRHVHPPRMHRDAHGEAAVRLPVPRLPVRPQR